MRHVQRHLVVGVRVHRRHQRAADAEVLVQHLGHRREAVGGAGRVRDDVVLGRVVLLVVDADDDRDVLVLGGRGDDDLLRAGVDVRRALSRR